MDSITKTRPSHYEALGLKPSASEEEIARAFARAMSPLRPHGISDMAAASVAYEALRDPVRRRAYDISIGLRPEKDAVPMPPEGWQLVSSIHVGPVAAAPVRPVARAPAPQPQPEREVARRPEPAAEIAPAPRSAFVPNHRQPGIQEAPVQWKRPAIVAGGMFAGVGLIGVAAGLWAARDVEPQKAEAAVVAGARHPEAPRVSTIEPQAAAPLVAQTRPERREETSRLKPAGPKVARFVASPASASANDPAPGNDAEALRADEAPEIPSAQVAEQASEASAILPLSNATIARTLRRIGYACGGVESTSAIAGGDGAFKVTCTSGQSYKAAPVRGRYHFRKWNGD